MGNNFFDSSFDISVSCATGVESVTKSQLKRLGYGDVPAFNGLLTFNGSAYDVARCNVNLRTADRVYVKIAQFNACTFDELFQGVHEIDWKSIIENNGVILVDGKCVKSKLFAISACQKIVKKAICTKLCGNNEVIESGAQYKIFFSIYKDEVQILLNTSGVGLHKRGYRDMVGIAPIKETLASSLLLLSDFYRERPFRDPFCGSGTLVIEGAMIALNVAPGKNRKFDFMNWKGFDKKHYALVKEECLDNELKNVKLDFHGSDIDAKAVKLATRHAGLAGLKDKVTFSKCDVKDFRPNSPVGTIVCNPPYGERVYDKKQAQECYSNLGLALKNFEGWSTFVITSDKQFERYFGRKADRERKLFNSDKECRYFYYYGKRQEKPSDVK